MPKSKQPPPDLLAKARAVRPDPVNRQLTRPHNFSPEETAVLLEWLHSRLLPSQAAAVLKCRPQAIPQKAAYALKYLLLHNRLTLLDPDAKGPSCQNKNGP